MNTPSPLEQDFLEQYPLVSFQKGEILIRQGQLIQYLYYIQSGVCACSILHTDGNTFIPLFLRKDEIVGVRQELLEVRENRSLHEIYALTAVSAYKIPVADVQYLLQNDFEVYKKLTKSVILSLDRIIEFANMRGKGNTAMMICAALMQEYPSTRQKDGSYKLPDYFTVSDCAKGLLIHRVTVSRIMHQLCEKGALKKENTSWYITDMHLLDKYRQGILTLDPVRKTR